MARESRRRPEVWLECTHTLSTRGRGRTGVGHYTEELVAGLAKDKSDAWDLSVVGNVFATAKPHFPTLPPGARVGFRLCRLFPGKVWNQLFKKYVLPPLNFLVPGRPDVVVFFNFVRYPLTRGVKSITVVHDLAYLKHPEAVQWRNRMYLRRFVPRAVKQSTRLVAVSEATKRDLIEAYGVGADRIGVVYPGVDLAHYSPTPLTDEVRARLGLPEKYFLFVSTLEPRKNVLGLIRAYRALPPELRQEYALVLTGGVGWLADEIMAEIARGDEVGRIVKTNYVPDADMPALYSGATAFVLPSLYEGFGMPALEAMACGVPVVAADNSSLPEVVGDAGLLVAAEDTAGWTAAMERLARDGALREELSRRGRERAKRFTWEQSTQQLAREIEKALQ